MRGYMLHQATDKIFEEIFNTLFKLVNKWLSLSLFKLVNNGYLIAFGNQ